MEWLVLNSSFSLTQPNESPYIDVFLLPPIKVGQRYKSIDYKMMGKGRVAGKTVWSHMTCEFS